LKVSELREDELIQEWLKSRKASLNTQQGYIACMQEYTEYTAAFRGLNVDSCNAP